MEHWQGRNDGEDALSQRIFQQVVLENVYEDIQPNDFVLHGFAVEEGVRRNKGRVGAKDAPNIIRKSMSNFPVLKTDFRLLDFGDIFCLNGDLEDAQNRLAEKIGKTLLQGGKSIVLGGGHEVTYGHYSGLKKAFPQQKIGIINFDAHFDNREPQGGEVTSGTGFWQIAQEESQIHTLHIGIQRNSNTLKLFDTAHQFGMQYILSDDLNVKNLISLENQLTDFIEQSDILYVTICMDVFNASIAPGVSAAAYNGIFVDFIFLQLFRQILQSDKTKALDVAEVNPKYDIQDRTARLAASLINEWLMI